MEEPPAPGLLPPATAPGGVLPPPALGASRSTQPSSREGTPAYTDVYSMWLNACMGSRTSSAAPQQTLSPRAAASSSPAVVAGLPPAPLPTPSPAGRWEEGQEGLLQKEAPSQLHTSQDMLNSTLEAAESARRDAEALLTRLHSRTSGSAAAAVDTAPVMSPPPRHSPPHDKQVGSTPKAVAHAPPLLPPVASPRAVAVPMTLPSPHPAVQQPEAQAGVEMPREHPAPAAAVPAAAAHAMQSSAYPPELPPPGEVRRAPEWAPIHSPPLTQPSAGAAALPAAPAAAAGPAAVKPSLTSPLPRPTAANGMLHSPPVECEAEVEAAEVLPAAPLDVVQQHRQAQQVVPPPAPAAAAAVVPAAVLPPLPKAPSFPPLPPPQPQVAVPEMAAAPVAAWPAEPLHPTPRSVVAAPSPVCSSVVSPPQSAAPAPDVHQLPPAIVSPSPALAAPAPPRELRPMSAVLQEAAAAAAADAVSLRSSDDRATLPLSPATLPDDMHYPLPVAEAPLPHMQALPAAHQPHPELQATTAPPPPHPSHPSAFAHLAAEAPPAAALPTPPLPAAAAAPAADTQHAGFALPLPSPVVPSAVEAEAAQAVQTAAAAVAVQESEDSTLVALESARAEERRMVLEAAAARKAEEMRAAAEAAALQEQMQAAEAAQRAQREAAERLQQQQQEVEAEAARMAQLQRAAQALAAEAEMQAALQAEAEARAAAAAAAAAANQSPTVLPPEDVARRLYTDIHVAKGEADAASAIHDAVQQRMASLHLLNDSEPPASHEREGHLRVAMTSQAVQSVPLQQSQGIQVDIVPCTPSPYREPSVPLPQAQSPVQHGQHAPPVLPVSQLVGQQLLGARHIADRMQPQERLERSASPAPNPRCKAPMPTVASVSPTAAFRPKRHLPIAFEPVAQESAVSAAKLRKPLVPRLSKQARQGDLRSPRRSTSARAGSTGVTHAAHPSGNTKSRTFRVGEAATPRTRTPPPAKKKPVRPARGTIETVYATDTPRSLAGSFTHQRLL